jgi:hypothetical protein
MKFKTFVFLLFIGGFSSAQSLEFTFQTKWDDDQKRCMPCDYSEITGELFSTSTKKINLRGNYDFNYQIEEIIYTPVVLPSYISSNLLPKKTDIHVSFGISRNENYLTINYQPIILTNGATQIIKEIKVSVSGTPKSTSQDREVIFASTSILNSGDWYKIGVPSEGVYRLTYDNLNSLGINVEALNPQHLNIYGNQTSELSEKNWIPRSDDLNKNSIFISGEVDLSFESDDYILFYAKGPDNLITNSGNFSPRKNKVDSLAYFFIHIDPADLPQRIGTTNNSPLSITNEVTSTNAFSFSENNENNLLKSGDGWYGKHFEGASLTESLTLGAENREVTEPVSLTTTYVSAVKSGDAGLKVTVNGVLVDDLSSDIVGGSYTVAKNKTSTVSFTSATENFNVSLEFYRDAPSGEAWIDFLQFNYIKKLRMGFEQLMIRDLRSVGLGNVCRYTISNASAGTIVWEVTDPCKVSSINGGLAGTNYSFTQTADSLRTYVSFNLNQVKNPVISGTYLGKISNQNLHGLPQADYLIITHESLKPSADRLANLHRANGLTVHIVEIQKVYNEFSGGVSDPVAVRWMAKMFYQRAAIDPSNTLKYLCLFGDGTYDPLNRIPNNNYLIPTYNSIESGDVDFLNSYTADDFFGLLDDTEAMGSSDMLDIGIGRMPVSDNESANQVIDKIERYMNYGSTLYSNAEGVQCDDNGYASTFGDWRNRIVLMADDENGGQFVSDCESLSDTTEKYHPEVNIVKIYLDAYKQNVTSGGQRYPDVEEAINQNMNKGALVFNYVGHGGETGLALERVVSIPMIQNWSNVNNMPIFISATCEFSRFDDPGRVSAGETTLTTPYGGAVGLLTTTRLVNIFVNTILVQNLYTEIFNELDGEPLALGEIIRRTKNLTLGSNNMRNFALLGDPALKLGKPRPQIITDSVNGVDITSDIDTLKALTKITIKGHVANAEGTILSDYNGFVYPAVFDKWKTRSTLGQDVTSPIRAFDTQTNIIYKGKSTVTNGEFTFSFVVPKDIDYAFGKGKISYYSNSDFFDTYGYDTTIVVGGVNPNGLDDEIGPEISLYMNDDKFVNGGITDSNPLFMASIRDENGINTTGNGIGHDITIIIDGDVSNPIVLNNFYESDLDTYQSGKVAYELANLSVGPHKIVFKVWDVNNNSSEATLDFVVVNEEEIGISHLLNYPNPFTTNTDFYFEHNQVCNAIQAKVEIFTVSGKLVKTIYETVNTMGFRSEGINWNGRDEFGDKLARGVYIYRLSIETEQGKKAEKIEKLVIL